VSRRLALAAALLILGQPAAIAQATPLISVVQDDAQMLRSGPAARERALVDWASLGADVVRIQVVWRDLADGRESLQDLDAAVAGAQRHGLDVLLNPTGPGPDRASTCRPQRGVCAPSPTRFDAWVATLGARYPTVHRWSVWNEPNNPNWLQPQRAPSGTPRSPQLYRALVRAASRALQRTGHGADLILAGETAPMPPRRSGPQARRPVAAGPFLRTLLAGRAPLGVTGIAHHPYPTGLNSPYGATGAAQFTLDGLPALIRLVHNAGRRHVLPAHAPVWLTELGIQTNPPDPFFGISPARQASWINQAEDRAQRDGAAALGQYLLVDEPALGGFQSGLRYADGRAKPSFSAYRLPLVLRRTANTLHLWGRVRPVRAEGATVELELRRAGAQKVRTLLTLQTRTGGDLSATLRPPRGQLRLSWTDATGRIEHGRWATVPAARVASAAFAPQP
jgi:hypothetical protein